MTTMAMNRPCAQPIRLTRRGRVAVVLAALAALLVGGFTLGHAPSQASGRVHHVAPRTITVQPGETLWGVAARIAPQADPRLVVDQLVRLNHLSGAGVAAGQQLVVPSTR